jgi:hypothetical protein
MPYKTGRPEDTITGTLMEVIDKEGNKIAGYRKNN